jgi:hypothetical protein
MDGAIEQPESVVVLTASGQCFRFSMVSLSTGSACPRGAVWPIRAGHSGLIELGLGGFPPAKDVLTPCVAVADGVDLPGDDDGDDLD